MLPKYQQDDYVLVLKPLFKAKYLNVGHDIVFNTTQFGLMIKTIIKIEATGVRVAGKNLDSIATDKIGLVPYANIIGKVIFHLKKDS